MRFSLFLTLWGGLQFGGLGAESVSSPPSPAAKAAPFLKRGQELWAAQQYEAALQKFQFAVRNDPGNASAHFWLGRCWAQLGRRQEGLQALEKAQKLDPHLRFTDKNAFQELVRKLRAEVDRRLPQTETFPGEKEASAVPSGKVVPSAKGFPSETPTALRPPSWPYGVIGGGAAGGLLVLWFLWVLVRWAQDKSHLTLHHAASQEFYRQVADGLTQARRALQVRPNPAAAAKVEAAELAFFEALDMLAPADREDTADLPKVRRARELLEKAQKELNALTEQLTVGEADIRAAWGCYFCSKPLPDREEGDVLALQKGGETRQFLICRGCSRRCRQKNVPPVRVVQGSNGMQHWATVADYEPFYDFYHDDRHGRETQPLGELKEPFITPTAAAQVLVEGGGRPDWVLRMEELPTPPGGL